MALGMLGAAGPAGLGCVPRAYTTAQSLAAGDAFLAVEPFRAGAFYDAAGTFRGLPGTAQPRSALRSYRFPDDHPLRGRLARRAFVYDLALAMIVHTLADRPREAAEIGALLGQLVDAGSGLPGFSLDLASPSFYDAGYLRAGVAAWVGYALALYDLARGERRFVAHARRVADALLAARVPPGSDPRAGLVRAGRGRWVDGQRRFEPAFAADYCVTEHQIDTWFLLDALGRLEPGRYDVAADALARAMLSALWLEGEGRFAVAVTAGGLDRGRALDAAGAWGTLFLLARGESARAHRALDFTRRTFATRVDGLDGFAPYADPNPEYDGYDFSRTLFSEGSAGMALALLRTGDRAGAERVAATLRALQARGEGGVLYATPEGPDMLELPAVAPTAWLLFLERELQGRRAWVFAPRISGR